MVVWKDSVKAVTISTNQSHSDKVGKNSKQSRITNRE